MTILKAFFTIFNPSIPLLFTWFMNAPLHTNIMHYIAGPFMIFIFGYGLVIQNSHAFKIFRRLQPNQNYAKSKICIFFGELLYMEIQMHESKVF